MHNPTFVRCHALTRCRPRGWDAMRASVRECATESETKDRPLHVMKLNRTQTVIPVETINADSAVPLTASRPPVVAASVARARRRVMMRVVSERLRQHDGYAFY
jgi:hypothetical protein